MDQHNHPLNVECPNCHHNFDVEASLSAQIERRLKAELAGEQQKIIDQQRETRELLQVQQRELDQRQADIDARIAEGVKNKEKAIRAQAVKQAEEARAEEFAALTERNKTQGKELRDLKKEQLAVLNQKEELERKAADLELDTKKAIAKERKRIEEEVQQREAEAHRMKDREKDLLLEKTLEQVEEMKRKIEQGAIQAQGEVQERELKEMLIELFRFDTIEDVAQGSRGADVLHTVNDRQGRTCGNITWESKRTKAFDKAWSGKLKEDMVRHRSDVGVIVTQTMPKGMPAMGLVDGIFVCSFREVAALAAFLREHMVRLAEVKRLQANQGERMTRLFEIFTSPEFKQQLQAIVNGHMVQQQQLEKEKRAMHNIWKAREGHIRQMLKSATHMQGALLGITGNSLDVLEELAAESQAAEPEAEEEEA